LCEAQFLGRAASRRLRLRSRRAIRSITRTAFHAVAGGSATIPLAKNTLAKSINVNNGLKWFVTDFVPNVETLHATSLRWTYKIHFIRIFAPDVETQCIASLRWTHKIHFLLPILPDVETLHATSL
jgi:hypothetical protein